MAVTSAGVGQTAAAGPTGHCSKRRRRGGSSPHVRPAARAAPAQAQPSGAALGSQRRRAADVALALKALPQQTRLLIEHHVVPIIVHQLVGTRVVMDKCDKTHTCRGVWALVHLRNANVC